MSSICHFYHLFAVIYKSIFYNWNITLNDWFICKNKSRRCMICLAYCYFSQWLQHFLPSLLVLSNSNILIVLIPSYSFPSLNWVIKLTLNWATVPHIEIAKRCIPENDLFGQHDYNIQFIDSFRFCVSLILLYNYHWHPFFFFFFVTLSPLSYFSHCKWLTFETDEKNPCSQIWWPHMTDQWVITTKGINPYFFWWIHFYHSKLAFFFWTKTSN